MNNISAIMTTKSIREDILRRNWSRHTSIRFDRLKYIKKPYTFEDVKKAVKLNSPKCLKEFLKDVKIVPLMLINDAETIEIFEILWNYYIDEQLLLKEDVINSLLVSIFIEKGCLDIVIFLYENGYITYNDIQRIEHLKMYDYLLEKNLIEKDWIDAYNYMNVGDELLIELIKDDRCNFDLTDAIYYARMDVIDYFLEMGVVPNSAQILDLLELGYDNLKIISDTDCYDTDIGYKVIMNGSYETIDNIMEAGFDRDTLIHCAWEMGEREIKDFLYNY